MATTLEDHKNCPKCGSVGKEVLNKRAEKPGARLHTFHCQNDKCNWYNTGWVIQVNADGTVPEPDMSSNRGFTKYPTMTDYEKTRAQEEIDRITQADQ